MDDFNQSSLGGIWGALEDAVFAEVDVDNLRVSVIGGPVFHEDDREFRGVRIPREFYKVLAYMENGSLKSKGFLLTQSLDELELFDLKEFKVFQVALSEIEQRCDFAFPNILKNADDIAEKVEVENVAERKPLESLKDIRW